MSGSTKAPDPRGIDYDGVLQDAVQDVARKKETLKAVEERQKPTSKIPLLAAMTVVLSAVLVWDVTVLSKAPEPMPDVELEANLRFEVRQLVQEIEAFRAVEERLPTAAELGPLLDDLIRYRANETSYLIIASDEGVQVQYDGSEPVDHWMQRSTAGEQP